MPGLANQMFSLGLCSLLAHPLYGEEAKRADGVEHFNMHVLPVFHTLIRDVFCGQHLRQELEAKFYEDRFDWEQVRHNDAAGLLKMFIRELPYPLLTLQHLPAFIAVLSESSSSFPLPH